MFSRKTSVVWGVRYFSESVRILQNAGRKCILAGLKKKKSISENCHFIAHNIRNVSKQQRFIMLVRSWLSLKRIRSLYICVKRTPFLSESETKKKNTAPIFYEICSVLKSIAIFFWKLYAIKQIDDDCYFCSVHFPHLISPHRKKVK